jgi:hypothetical protein
MKAGIPRSLGQKMELANCIDTVDYFVPSDRPDDLLAWDFWLGNSRDGQVWGLFATAVRYLDDEQEDGLRPDQLVAYLLGPPKRNTQTIGEILLAVHQAFRKNPFLSEHQIQSIIRSIEFPTYRTVGDYLPSSPEEWQQLPAELIVSFELSEGAGVCAGTFDAYRRDSLEEAVAIVYMPRIGGLLLRYSLVARELIPMTPYEVDWPLARRGREHPYKRGKVPGTLPWDRETSTALVILHQHVARRVGWMPTPSYFAKPVVRLTVAGRSQDNAIANWTRVATQLRACRPHRSEGRTRDNDVADSTEAGSAIGECR